jgi:hypothetical protein
MKLEIVEKLKEIPKEAKLSGYVGKGLKSNGDSIIDSSLIVSNVSNYRFKRPKGFIKVKSENGEELYYQELIFNFLPFLIVGCVVFVCGVVLTLGYPSKGRLVGNSEDDGEGNITAYDTEYKDTHELPEQRETIIDGIVADGEFLECDKDYELPLGNNEENKKTGVSLQFNIVDENDKVVFKTKKIKPGLCTYFKPADYFEKGEHNITVKVNVFLEDGTQTVGTDMHVKIKVS